MPYIVPQFIEKETRIAGPFTFKQLVFLGTAAGLAVLFYFTLPFFLFIIAAIFLAGTAAALIFFKVSGHPLPTVIKNFLIFLTREKIYLWKKKVIPPKIMKRVQAPKTEIQRSPALKASQRGSLRELSTFLETKTR